MTFWIVIAAVVTLALAGIGYACIILAYIILAGRADRTANRRSTMPGRKRP